jgi:NPCBM-associated, NEW3 domain of alpha-galactosidase
MRSFAITAVIGTGLLGLAPQAQAASHTRPAHPEPGRFGAANAARPADPQPGRPGAQPAVHARPADPQPGRPAEHGGHDRRTDPQNVNVRVDQQPGRPAAPRPVQVKSVDPQPQPVRPSYALHITGQATHWEVSPGELQTVRWTLTNTGNRPLEHVQLVASVPAGWSVREGHGCTHDGDYLGCDLGSLEPGRTAAAVVPLVVQGQPGPVRLVAWSRATAGSLTIPGPTTSFRVMVTKRR